MNKQEQIKKIKDKIKELEKEVEKLENSKEKWVPKENENIYYVDEYRDVSSIHYDPKIDFKILKYNKLFKTQEEAEHYRDYLNARDEASYNFSEEEWENTGINKWYIYCDCICKKNKIIYDKLCRDLGKIYFKTKEDTQDFIDKWSKEIKEYEFGITE